MQTLTKCHVSLVRITNYVIVVRNNFIPRSVVQSHQNGSKPPTSKKESSNFFFLFLKAIFAYRFFFNSFILTLGIMQKGSYVLY